MSDITISVRQEATEKSINTEQINEESLTSINSENEKTITVECESVEQTISVSEESVEQEISVELEMYSGADPYEGTYTVTPTTSSQTLETNGLQMSADLTVEAIPPNYIDTSDATLYNGAWLLSGYTAYADGVLYTGSMPRIAVDPITPSTSNVYIDAGSYIAAQIIVYGDENLVSENIAENVSIFGIEGSYKSVTITQDSSNGLMIS